MKQRIQVYWADFVEFLKAREYLWRYKLIICLPILIGLILIDVLCKQLAWHYLPHGPQSNIPGDTVKFLNGFINLSLVVNKGIAFGANSGNLAENIVLATLITLFAIIIFIFSNKKIALIGITLLISGGIGNLIDRMWNNGGVVDFLAWELFPPYSIFNTADMFVTFGCIIIVIAILIEIWLYFYEIKKGAKDEREDSNLNSESRKSE